MANNWDEMTTVCQVDENIEPQQKTPKIIKIDLQDRNCDHKIKGARARYNYTRNFSHLNYFSPRTELNQLECTGSIYNSNLQYIIRDYHIKIENNFEMKTLVFPIFLQSLEFSFKTFLHINQIPILIKRFYVIFLNKKYETNYSMGCVFDVVLEGDEGFNYFMGYDRHLDISFSANKPFKFQISIIIIPYISLYEHPRYRDVYISLTTFSKKLLTLKQLCIVLIVEIYAKKIGQCMCRLKELNIPKTLHDICISELRVKQLQNLLPYYKYYASNFEDISSTEPILHCKYCHNIICIKI